MIPTNKKQFWQQVRPVLDSAVAELDELERDAILLHFLKNEGHKRVAAVLQLTEITTHVVLSKGLRRLNGVLVQRGIASTPAALAAALNGQAPVVAPIGLAETVTRVALTSALPNAANCDAEESR